MHPDNVTWPRLSLCTHLVVSHACLQELARLQTDVEDKCGALFGAVAASEDEQERAQTTMALHYCVSSVVCPPAAAAFMSALERAADVDEGVIDASKLVATKVVEVFASSVE